MPIPPCLSALLPPKQPAPCRLSRLCLEGGRDCLKQWGTAGEETPCARAGSGQLEWAELGVTGRLAEAVSQSVGRPGWHSEGRRWPLSLPDHGHWWGK